MLVKLGIWLLARAILSLNNLEGEENSSYAAACGMVLIAKRMRLPGTKHPAGARPSVHPDGHALISAYHPCGNEHLGHALMICVITTGLGLH